MTTISADQLHKDTAKVLQQVAASTKPVIIKSADQKLVILPFHELKALEETGYLLSSKKNRTHLKKSLQELSDGDIVIAAMKT